MLCFLNNPQLTTIKADYPGNAMLDKRFLNYQKTTPPNWKQILRWQLSYTPQKTINRYSRYRPERINDIRLWDKSIPKIVWLGHASYLITLNGKNILTDPVFRSLPLIKRRVKIPFTLESYNSIDYILISHAHYDHLDKKTLVKLCQLNPHAHIYCGLNTADLLRNWNISNPICEAGWYQQYPLAADKLEFYFLPAQHWSNRSLKDRNLRLWGSFIIKNRDNSIYFMGDSAAAGHFSEIGQLFPQIDYAIMGIGAYQPQYIMHSSHLNPEEAYHAYQELGAKYFIPMHYGTYILSDEPLREPLAKTRNLFNEQPEQLCELAIGEVLTIIESAK